MTLVSRHITPSQASKREAISPQSRAPARPPPQETDKSSEGCGSCLFFALARFQRASNTTKHVIEKYHELLSSPTRSRLRQVGKVVTEAVLLENMVTAYVDNRRMRIEKRYHKKRRGKRAKPQGDFSHNVSLAELRQQQKDVIGETREKEYKAQIRSARRILRQKMDKFKEKWRAGPARIRSLIMWCPDALTSWRAL